MIIFLPRSMIPITLLKWDWVTLWIVLSRSSTQYSHIVDGSLVWCMLLKIKQQNDIRMRVWFRTLTYKKVVHRLVFPSKTIWELYSLFIPIIYKLIGNGGLLNWMHLYNCIGYIFPFFSNTHKHNIQNKFHNDGVTKVVTPHSYKLNFLTPHL